MSRKGEEERMTRIAIVDPDKCKPKKCKQECKRNCPVVRMGKLCIEVTPNSKISSISEELCIGCGICVKRCPFGAISIINLPRDLEKETTHRYGPNSFKLHRLPMPRPGQVLGLVGTNGIGKSTALKVLAGKLKPNLGRFENPPDWSEILRHYRGSDLQNFFTRLLEENIKAIIKPQYVDHIPRAVKGEVGQILQKKDDRKVGELIAKDLDLNGIMERKIGELSGGELQRFAIGMVCVQQADIYMFDEPSSYLDVRQRLNAAHAIRELCTRANYVIVVEHDLSVLDYLSDFVCCLYGKPGAYGVVTMPFSVREGINIFLAGFVPTENLRFRQVALSFKVAENVQDLPATERHHNYQYPRMEKQLGKGFHLTVEPGSFTDSEIIVMLGQNGTGKTTFIRMLAGVKGYHPDNQEALPSLNVSYKPQKIAPQFEGSVRALFHKKIRSMYVHPQFVAEVMKPMSIDDIIDQEVKNLSGGELQRVAIVLALGKPADIYLIDEPSAYLDSEQRIVAAKVIKRFILHSKKTAFIVEHDFIMATYLADRVIVYTGEPAKECVAHSPQSLVTGMNSFLKDLEITFRRDPTNYRPRINKRNSVKDQDQKRAGTYFYMDDDDDDDEEGGSSKSRSKHRAKAKAKDDDKAGGGVSSASYAAPAPLKKEPKKSKAGEEEAGGDENQDLWGLQMTGDRIKEKKPKEEKKAKKSKGDDDEEDDGDLEDGDLPPPKAKKGEKKGVKGKADAKSKAAAKPKATKAKKKDDDEDAEDKPKPKPKAAAAKSAKPKASKKKDEDEDAGEDKPKPKPKAAAAAKSAKPKAAAKAKKPKEDDDDES